MNDGAQLLAEYVRTGSEPAFRELVARYVDLVYSAAVRLVDGDTHRAEDVTQTVFADLAGGARALPSEVMLGGWLHRHTCFVAAKLMRGERRRRSRERQAVEMNALQQDSEADLKWIAPMLDEAIDQLEADDRTAILLRFFEQRDFRSVGEGLGSTEEAARKRVSRALDKLHDLLKRRGVVFPAAALATVLATQAVTAAPAGMAVAVSGAALAGAGSLTLLKLMTMTNLKFAMFGAVAVAATAAVPLTIQHRSQLELRNENQSLRRQVAELPVVAANPPLQGRTEPVNAASSTEPPSAELLRLRNEVTRLKSDSEELARLKAASKNVPGVDPVAADDFMARVKERLEQMPNLKIPELQFLTAQDWQMASRINPKPATDDDFRRVFSSLRQFAKSHFAPKVGLALHQYAQANSGLLPANLQDLKGYLAEPISDVDAMLQRYELKQTGKLDDVPQTDTYPPASGNPGMDAMQAPRKTTLPWTEPIVTEKAPVDDQYDSLFTLTKYGYSFKSFGTGRGAGSGTWAKINADGKPELLSPRQGGGANGMSSMMESSGSSGGGGGGGGGFGSMIAHESGIVRATNSPAAANP